MTPLRNPKKDPQPDDKLERGGIPRTVLSVEHHENGARVYFRTPLGESSVSMGTWWRWASDAKVIYTA